MHRNRRLAAISAALFTGSLVAALSPAVAGNPSDAPTGAGPFGPHRVVVSGLDNPRQLVLLNNGDLLVAEAGHGGNDPANCAHGFCIGKTGKVTRIRGSRAWHVMTGLLSGAGRDGTFAVGSDGAGHRPGGPYYAIVTQAPPDEVPEGLPGWQSGRLLKKLPGGTLKGVANISRFEATHDPDGEGVESNPYSMLALRHRILVADAAGDYIAQVRHGKVSLWALMPEYGPKTDAVPTVLTKGPDGKIYVGELHSEQPGQAKVWKYNRRGEVLRSWGHFTTVTGVARGRDGSLYVSELFGGNCSFDDIPKCFPGRVVRISPNGDRSYRRVPFPAGIVAKNGHAFVVAFSVSPANGFGSNPAWSGQVWRIFN